MSKLRRPLNVNHGNDRFTKFNRARGNSQLDAISVNVDWQFAKKFDLYAGFMYSAVQGGIGNGYQVLNNWAPTAGLRFRF